MKSKEHDESDLTLKFTDEPDAITGISFPGDPKRVKMSCGHAVDPNTLAAWCRSLLDQQKVKFHCPAITEKDAKGVMKKQCKKVWDYAEVRRIALLNDAECGYFESKLSEYAALQYCDMKECPGCRSFVEREDLTNLHVTCPVCSKKKGRTYDFCWQCLQDWTGLAKSAVKCGNSTCVHPELASVQNAPMFTLNDKKVQCCDMKECPGCRSFVEREDLTNLHVTCPVCSKKKGRTYDFCWQCLQDWTGLAKSAVKCGNSTCVHPELASVQDSLTFTLNGKEVPLRRACPTCGKVVEHMNDKTCKFMICPRCQNEYCFMCLELKSECLRTAPLGWFKECAKPIADKQTAIPVWTNNPRNTSANRKPQSSCVLS